MHIGLLESLDVPKVGSYEESILEGSVNIYAKSSANMKCGM